MHTRQFGKREEKEPTMGNTPRTHTLQIPLPIRSTEASAECFGRQVLTWVREEDAAPAVFFDLGTLVHEVIEYSIERDWTLDDALAFVDQQHEIMHDHLQSNDAISGSVRTLSTLRDDATRMATNWFAHVHPDSDKRHPVYDEYVWPPQTEVRFNGHIDGIPVWGTIDAIFDHKHTNPPRIVDWKSNRKRPSDSFQLDFYRLGAQIPEADAHFHMLDRIRKSSIVVEAEPVAYRRTTSRVRQALANKESVLRGELPEFIPGWYCNYCPVQHICPADGHPDNRLDNKKELVRLLSKVEVLPEIVGS